MDKPLTVADFADKIGQRFAIEDGAGSSIASVLTEAKPLNPGRGINGARPPFSLVFVADQPQPLPQRIYRMEHDTLGIVSIFLVPIGRDARGISYQATFN
jgi:hypothetical protein